jgi:signal transduction histidine kinase
VVALTLGAVGKAGSFASVEAENRLLHRVVETITSNLGLDAVLRSIVDLVAEATRGDACFLHLWDARSGGLVLRAASAGFEEAVGRVRLRLGEGVAGWVAEHRQVVAIPEDKWADPRYKYIPELAGERFTSMLSVPAVSRSGALVGVFNVHSRERRQFGDRDIDFLRLTASLVAEAIDHANLFGELAEKERALEALIRKTIEAQEEERRRVATELHDGVTQQLVSVWYRLQACGRSLRDDPDRADRELAAARQLVDEALAEARAAIYDLRPSMLDDLGLSPSLRELARRQLEGEVELRLDVDDVGALPAHHEVALYRIAQEAVTNIRKHAGARRVVVSLRSHPDCVELTIEDDGTGFEVQSVGASGPRTSFGMTGMAERASLVGSELMVRSAPARGTAVSVRIRRQETAATDVTGRGA